MVGLEIEEQKRRKGVIKVKKYKEEIKSLKEYEMFEIEEAYKQLEQITKNVKKPKKIYRYRPLNVYTIDELINEHVFLSSPNIDDIFDTTIVNNGKEAEGILAAYYFTKYYREKDPKMNENYKIYTEYFENFNRKLRENVRIACFTESNTNVPMWQYYAEKNTGICIEYSINVEKLVNNNTNIYFLPVIYTKDYNEYFPYDLNEDKKNKLVSIICSVLKMEEWIFEKEWRIIGFKDEKLEENPYVKLEINAIYFGIETPQSIKNVIKRLVDEKISLYEMKKELTGLEVYELR